MTVTSEEEPEKPSTGASSSTTQECAGLRKRNASATPAEMTIDPQQAPARPHTWGSRGSGAGAGAPRKVMGAGAGSADSS